MNREKLKEETKIQLDRIAEFGDGPLEFETRFVESVIRETEFLEFARNMIDSAVAKWTEKRDLHIRVYNEALMYTKEDRLKNFHFAAIASAVASDLESLKESIKFREVAE